jgi:hypothetical protein
MEMYIGLVTSQTLEILLEQLTRIKTTTHTIKEDSDVFRLFG